MKVESLKRAKILQEEIEKINNYLWYEERPSFVRLFRKLLKVSSKTMLGEHNLELDSDLQDKIRNVIIQHKEELEKQLDDL